jgi:hypothetical protein
MKYRVTLITLAFLFSGCSQLIEKKASAFGDQLTQSMLNFEDPATVSDAMPTFIILMNSMASQKDAGPSSKLATAQLLGAYSSAFVADEKRQKTLANLAFNYAKEGSCQMDKRWCSADRLKGRDFSQFTAQLTDKDVALIYSYAGAWLGYINTHSDDWNAIANLQHCKMLLELVIKFDESYDHAGAHLYLGAIASALPEAIGGKPAIAKKHFERAIELTGGKNLVVKVEYARRYARATFNKKLHHQLLTEVLAADPEVPGLTLMNAWAQEQARVLLAEEDDYFF